MEGREANDDSGSVFPGFGAVDGGTAELIERLATLRQTNGLSQTEVASRMGTSQSAVARLESGRADVRLSTLTRYADAVDGSIGFAVRERKDPT